jgi:hypothetical protein
LRASQLLFQIRKIPLGFHSGGASLTGSGDSLAIEGIRHIAGGEDPGQTCLCASLLEEVAIGIHLNFAFKRLCIRGMADRDENAFYAQFRMLARFDISEFDTLNFTLRIGDVDALVDNSRRTTAVELYLNRRI